MPLVPLLLHLFFPLHAVSTSMEWAPCLTQYLSTVDPAIGSQVQFHCNYSSHPALPSYFFEEGDEHLLPANALNTVPVTTLRIQRMPCALNASSPADEPYVNLWLLPGGPGQGIDGFNPAVLFSYLDVFQIEEYDRATIYVPQLRLCDFKLADFSRVERFFDYLQGDDVDDSLLSAISTEQAAEDVLRILEMVEQTCSDRPHLHYIHGVSYGGMHGLEMVRMAPTKFKYFVFDSGSSPFFQLNDLFRGHVNFLHELLQLCSQAGNDHCPVSREILTKAFEDPDSSAVQELTRIFHFSGSFPDLLRKLSYFLFDLPQCFLKTGSSEKISINPAFLAIALLRAVAIGGSQSFLRYIGTSVSAALGLKAEKLNTGDFKVVLDGFTYGDGLKPPDGSDFVSKLFNHYIFTVLVLGELWTDEEGGRSKTLDSSGRLEHHLFQIVPNNLYWMEKCYEMLKIRPWFQRFRRHVQNKEKMPPTDMCTTRILLASAGLDFQTPSGTIRELADKLKERLSPSQVFYIHVPTSRHIPLFRYRYNPSFLDLIRDFFHGQLQSESDLARYPIETIDWDSLGRFFFDEHDASTVLAVSSPKFSPGRSTGLLYIVLGVVIFSAVMVVSVSVYWVAKKRSLRRQRRQARRSSSSLNVA